MKLRKIGLAATIWLATPALSAPLPGVPDGWSSAFVYSNGARLHYYRGVPRPGKPVIVMVHGITDNGLSWTTLTQDLQDDYDIYMLDARGHGLSDPFTDADTADSLAKDVVGFVQAMKLDRPILMGHSMGAATVMRLAAQYPGLPRAVVMLDPLLGRLPPVLDAAVAPVASAAPARRPGQLVMFGDPETLVRQNNASFDEWLTACGEQNPLWDPLDCQYWALSKKQYHGFYSPAQMQAVRGNMAVEDALARIPAPALILKADASDADREAHLKTVAKIRKGKLVHLEGAGHNLHHDKRARTVELLKEFLGKL